MAATRGPLTAVDALAGLTGRDADELRRHPRLLLTALADFGRDVVKTALELADEDPGVRERAERRRAELLDRLGR